MMKFKRWQIIGVFALMIVAGLLAWFRVSYSPLKNIFQERVEQEKQKTTAVNGVFSSEDFSQFPVVIQRYMTHCGYVGTPKMSHMRMDYGKVNFKMNRSSQAMRVEYVQYNFASYPSRLALIDASIFGIPFEGMDYYYEGHCGMKGVLAKLIPLFDQQGEEMNRSCLVTYLAECLFMPMALMENDITFEAIDDQTVKASITYGGETVSGIFVFNEHDEMIAFTTNDRSVTNEDGSLEQIPWTARCGNYRETEEGFKQPTTFQAVWHFSGGDFVYFDGVIDKIAYEGC